MSHKRDNRFDEMLTKMLPRLRKYALYLTHNNVAESEDLVGSVVLRCLEKHHQFMIGSSFNHWAARIMYTIYVDSVRKSARRTTCHLNDYDDDFVSNDDPSSSQLILELRTGLQKLPLHSRKIIINAANGDSYLRIAEKERVSIGSVRYRLSRDRAMLREHCDRGDSIAIASAREGLGR